MRSERRHFDGRNDLTVDLCAIAPDQLREFELIVICARNC